MRNLVLVTTETTSAVGSIITDDAGLRKLVEELRLQVPNERLHLCEVISQRGEGYVPADIYQRRRQT
jgi:hypothetical protein